MAIEKGKPDLLTVLTRRKSTVGAFLDQSGVVDLVSLQTLIKSLETTWSLSNEFMREANAHVLKKYSLEAASKKAEEKPEPIEDVRQAKAPVKKKTKKSTSQDEEDSSN